MALNLNASIRKKLEDSPAKPRIAPFVIFLALTWMQGKFGATSVYWIYALKTFVGAWLVWATLPLVREMRYQFSREAVVVGVGVFVMWIGMDPLFHLIGFENSYPKLGSEGGEPWNPHTMFGQNSPVAWTFILIRLLGSSLVVPALEEVFYRSWLYRYVVKPRFEEVSLVHFAWTPMLVTAVLFASTHNDWLSALICGIVYQWLVLKKGRLGDAMTAHGITNFLLALYVIFFNQWRFW